MLVIREETIMGSKIFSRAGKRWAASLCLTGSMFHLLELALKHSSVSEHPTDSDTLTNAARIAGPHLQFRPLTHFLVT